MQEITVTTHSDPALVAQGVSDALQNGRMVEVQVDTVAAVPVMLKAIRSAQRSLFDRGLVVTDAADLAPTEALDTGAFANVCLMARPRVAADDDSVFEASILEDFAERQALYHADNELVEKLAENTADSPILSGGDLDAAWDMADVGEETVGGTVSTPGQNRVDELGEAVGLTYDDDEPLDTEDKLAERDEHRWELDPRSADDEQ